MPTGSYALLLAEQVLGTQVYHVVPLGRLGSKPTKNPVANDAGVIGGGWTAAGSKVLFRSVFTEDSHGSSPRDWPASSLANAEGEFAVKEQLEKLVLQMYRSGIRYSESVREFQSVFILTVLREQRANQVRAAQKLGMHRNTLRRIIRNFELDIRPLRPSTRRPPLSERAVPVQTKARAR